MSSVEPPLGVLGAQVIGPPTQRLLGDTSTGYGVIFGVW